MIRTLLLLSLLLLVGCLEKIEAPDRSKPVATAKPEETAEPESKPEPEPEKRDRGVIGQKTDEVVNAKDYADNPNFIVSDGKIEGNNPLRQSASGYFTLGAKASTLGMQQWVQTYHALNEEWPPYEEFMNAMKEHRVELMKLRWYEKYAYDEDTGQIIVLIDVEAKERGRQK